MGGAFARWNMGSPVACQPETGREPDASRSTAYEKEEELIVTVVRFSVRPGIGLSDLENLFADSIDKFVGMGGLKIKYFMKAAEDPIGASVYLWNSMDDARNFFTEEWMEFMQAKYGDRPQLDYFDCPIVIDNLHEEVLRS
jgi:hypothetical protein